MMRRARPCSLACLALAGVRASPALRRRRVGPGRGDAALGRGRADRGPGRAGWCATSWSTGSARPAAAPRLSARRRARRQYHRLRHPRRPRGDARAADAARALPAGRRSQPARWCSTRPPDRTPASTSSAPNMRPSPPSRPRSSICPTIVADQIVARLGALRGAHAAGASEGEQGSDRPRGRPARPRRSASICSTARTRRSRAALGERLLKALGATQVRSSLAARSSPIRRRSPTKPAR